jgi:hypothetical protein
MKSRLRRFPKQYHPEKGRDFIMSKMIAFCGLVCSDCPTYIVTINDAQTKIVRHYN